MYDGRQFQLFSSQQCVCGAFQGMSDSRRGYMWGVRDVLWRNLPPARRIIQELEASDAEDSAGGTLGAYSYISEVLWWGVFVPAIECQDHGLIDKCFAVVEDLYRQGDGRVVEPLDIRIVSHLSTTKYETVVDRHAGPLLRARLVWYREL